MNPFKKNGSRTRAIASIACFAVIYSILRVIPTLPFVGARASDAGLIPISDTSHNLPVMKRPTLLLDEMLFGMYEYLEDEKWDLIKVTDKLGESPGDKKIVEYAHKENLVVISLDKKVRTRCKVKGTRFIDLGFEELARWTIEKLNRDYPK